MLRKTKLLLIFIVIAAAILHMISMKDCDIVNAEVIYRTANGETVDVILIDDIYDGNGERITYTTVKATDINPETDSENIGTIKLKFNTVTREITRLSLENMYTLIIIISCGLFLIVNHLDSKAYYRKINI